MTLLMVSGNIDLSIGSIMAMTARCSAIVVTWGIPTSRDPFSVLIGTADGFVNGFLGFS